MVGNAAHIGLALAALVVTARAAPAQEAAFRSPSGNLHCMWFQDELRCDVLDNAARPPRRPANCELDYGSAFGLRAAGPAQRLCVGDSVANPRAPVLAYGKEWLGPGIRCTMEQAGITCTNRAGRGFRLRRASQELF